MAHCRGRSDRDSRQGETEEMAVQFGHRYGYVGCDLCRCDSVIAQALQHLGAKLRVFACYAAWLACPIADA